MKVEWHFNGTAMVELVPEDERERLFVKLFRESGNSLKMGAGTNLMIINQQTTGHVE